MTESDTSQQTVQHSYIVRNTEILEMIATGQSASKIYDAIALMYEAKNPGLRCSLLELKGNLLMHGGAPSLPKEYCDAIHGLKNGPDVGSCGTSTYTGKRVLVENIDTDPKWADIKHVALPHGMRCCWSEPIKNSNGKVLGAFGMYFDNPALPTTNQLADLESAGRLASIVMDRDQRDKELSRTHKMETINQLTGGIAHDFNNLLGIILGNLELLEYQIKADDKTQRKLDNIGHAAKRASDLTKKLVLISDIKIEKPESVNINQSIDDMHNLLMSSLTPQINITQSFAEDLWHTSIDPGDFENVLINLILNARDAVAGKGSISIETQNCILDEAYCKLYGDIDAGEFIRLSVSDNGQGISQELQEHIFDPFFTTKDTGKGTGLGLAMVFGFIKRSNGCIKVYSEKSIGTTINVYLPRITEGKKATGTTQDDRKLHRGNEKILVVDDEAELLVLVEETLSGLGYEISTATNGIEALQILATEPEINILFSDVVMPGDINGFELAEQAAELYPDLQILLTSGYTDMALSNNGQAKYKTDLLLKPYSIYDMTHRLRQTLDD